MNTIIGFGLAFIIFFILTALFYIIAIGFTQFKGFTRADIKKKAWSSLIRRYWQAFAVSIVGIILTGGFYNTISIRTDDIYRYEDLFRNEPFSGSISYFFNEMSSRWWLFPFTLGVFLLAIAASIVFSIFVGNIIQVGLARYFILNTKEKPKFTELFYGFKASGNYTNICKTMFIRNLYIFLWSLLFIIPGIIKAYQYYMVPYILSENPDMDTKEALQMSKELTASNKWRIYVLGLSFIGWELLGVICFGVGLYFVFPYQFSTYAVLYLQLTGRNNDVEISDISDKIDSI